MADPNEAPLGTGIASMGKATIKQQRCIRDKIIAGMSTEQAKEACSVKVDRQGKKRGGLVSKKKGGAIHAASRNHKFSY